MRVDRNQLSCRRPPWVLGLVLIAIALLGGGVASAQAGPKIPAFLPNKESVPASQAMPIDGTWMIDTIGKKIRVEAGRAYAVDGWLHLFVLDIQPGMVVIKEILPSAAGEYAGEDLPLMGQWNAKVQGDRNLAVTVPGVLGPVSYQLIPVQLDSPTWFDQEMRAAGLSVPADAAPGARPDYRPTPRPGPPAPQPPAYRPSPEPQPAPAPGSPGVRVGESLADLGRACFEDFKPMGAAMLKYAACQKGLGRINALKSAIKVRNMGDVKGIVEAAACRMELSNMVDTLKTKGFQSFSLGVSGEVSAGIGGSGEYFVAMNLDLSDPTLYATVGGGLGVQLGGSIGGVVSAYYGRAEELSGGGKSFAVALSVLGGGGGAVGISSGKSPRCDSFSASAGVGGLANTGSISLTQTFKLIDIPKPDFTPGCKDVRVTARNRTGKEIKIVDVDFYDYENGRWRSKVIKNTRIDNGRNWSKNLRLQKVGGDRTRVRVQYRIRDGHSLLNPWSKVINRESPAKTCRTGSLFSVDLR